MGGSEPALCIALLGAESTGKTALAEALPARIAALTGLRCTQVPEHLRLWCEAQGRTPRQEEQAAIARAQQQAIDAAALRFDVVVCDTTPLMTAVYQHQVFGDTSLDDAAVAAHRRCQVTLLTALDLPWRPDGHQRDGAHVREPVDARLRWLMQCHGIAFSVVSGQGEQRIQSALEAVGPALYARLRGATPARSSGLFTGLPNGARWRCVDCGDPGCQRPSHGSQSG